MHRRFFALLGAAIVAASILVMSGGLATAARMAKPPRPVFPVTVIAVDGKLTIKRQPRRIVSLSATATEELIAPHCAASVRILDLDGAGVAVVPARQAVEQELEAGRR